MSRHKNINYIEFPATDISKTKDFYGEVFGWEFQDWGDSYISFTKESAGIDGGFELNSPTKKPSSDGTLVVLYSDDLESTVTEVERCGGTITAQPFEFPGGRRFHFSDPNGNHLAVWSEN